MRKSKVLTALVLAVALAVSLAGCTTPGTSGGTGTATKAPYKIGAIVSLTGTYAGLGTPEKNAIEMELKKLNAAGGVNGHPVEVIFEDDATDEAKAVAAASRLITRDKVLALIGATGTGQTMAVRAEVDKAGVPQVSMAGGNAVTAKFDPLVFQTPWPNTLVVPFVLDYLKDTGLTKVGIITDSGGYGKDGLAVIDADLAKYGLTAVGRETFNPGDTDMTTQLTKLKGAGADAILMWTAGKEAAIIAKNMKQLGMTIPLVGGSGIARKEFISGAGEGAEGVLLGTGKILIPGSWGTDTKAYAVATSFVADYTAAYGQEPDIFAGHAYDAFYLIVDAMKRLPEGFTPAQLRDEIEKTKGFVGIDGTFTFSPTDHNGMSENDLVMYRIEGGKWVLEDR